MKYLEYALVAILALVLLVFAAPALLYLIGIRERRLLIVYTPIRVFTWGMAIAILLGLKGVALVCGLCLFGWVIALSKLAELLP